MKFNGNEKIDINTLNNLLMMLNAKPIKIKAKQILLKDLLLLLVRSYRQKIKKNKKGGDPDSCYFPANQSNPIFDYLNTNTLNFNASFPPPSMTYYRDFV